jgi:hypothetical protein
MVVPAEDLHQPLDFNRDMEFLVSHLVSADESGNFSVSGLEDGDYIIISTQIIEGGTPPPESIAVIETLDGTVLTRRVVRVTVTNGEAVTGVEIIVRWVQRPPAPQLSPPMQVSPPSQISPGGGPSLVTAPITGTGPGPTAAERTGAYAGLAFAGLAALLLAGGVALRARRVL